MSQLTLFSNGAAVPAYLRADQDDATDALAGGSSSYKRISVRGSVWRMIVSGKEVAQNEDRALNMIIVAAAPNNSRTFYGKTFVEGEALRPDCTSLNGDKPDASIKNPQASTCAACPQNIAGSGPNGARACRYSRRLAVVLENDLSDEASVYQLVVPAQSLFGTGENGKLPLTAYAQFLKANGVQVTGVVTEARFDTSSSTPKITFRAVRPLTEEEYYFAKEKGKTIEAINAISFDPASMDLCEAPKAQSVSARPSAAKAKNEDVVEFVAEPAPVAEPKKVASTKKAEAPATPTDIDSLLDEWDD